ncbi:MAG: hypothetical protein HQK76_18630 [Desulfobacterales bacterium]|nr:hypothetical protein [Desulfobacterales bacterium]
MKEIFVSLSKELQWIISGLNYYLNKEGEDVMKIEITPEDVKNVGKEWINAILSGLKPEERLSGLKPEERLSGLKLEERLLGLKPEKRLFGLKPEERLSGLKLEDIEAYLEKIKKK